MTERDKPLALTTEYTTPYAAVLRENVVMGVARYFLERWLPVLGPGPATVVNTLRQLDYRCQDNELTISGAALAHEAAMSRRHLYTCLDHPWMVAFARVQSGQPVRHDSGKVSQQPNRYVIRMDDTLTPADAEHLLCALKQLADTPLEATRRALEMRPRDLWATDSKGQSGIFEQPAAITAQNVLWRAFPDWNPVDAGQKQERIRLAETLHRHVTLVQQDGRASKVIVPQYFRQKWWKYLGHDLAWIYLWLRSNVYDNPAQDERRDTCWIPALEPMLTLIGRSREWWRRNVENAKLQPDNWQISQFFEQINAQKGRDPAQPQWVARQFRVALDVPIAPEDRDRYAVMLAQWGNRAITRSATDEHTGNPRVRHIDAHRAEKGPPQMNTPAITRSATDKHTGNQGVRHMSTQGSATDTHRGSKLLKKVPLKEEELNTPQHTPNQDLLHEGNAGGGEIYPVKEKQSLFGYLEKIYDHIPATPLYQAVSAETWLAEAWPEPVRPHTPAWNATINGAISCHDLVALILAVWADKSINHPPRYLSWLIQRWQTQPDVPPVDRWEQWQDLAEMSVGEWAERGRALWDSLTGSSFRDLPFGLDTLFYEVPTFGEPLNKDAKEAHLTV